MNMNQRWLKRDKKLTSRRRKMKKHGLMTAIRNSILKSRNASSKKT